jgi:uncharacterized membrane protein YedE/YeeE
MPIGKKLYILEWVLFAVALLPAIFAQAVPADDRGLWYMAALVLMVASGAVQALRWWGPDRFAFAPAPDPSSRPEVPAGEVDFNRSGSPARDSSPPSFRYSCPPRSLRSSHSIMLIIMSIAASLSLLYALFRSAVGDPEPLRIWFALAFYAIVTTFRIIFGWSADKPVPYKPAYKPGWRSIRLSGNLRKHKHKR